MHRYKIDEGLYDEIAFQLGEHKNLPFAVEDVIDNRIYDFMDDEDSGIYRVWNDKEDPRDALLVVLDRTRMELIIMLSHL